MKTALILTGILALSVSAHAVAKKVEPKAAKAPVAATAKKNVSRDIRFSGSQVDGKYLSAGESVAEVEGDKEMGALIGIRKNFRDRLNEEKARLEAKNSQSAPSGKGQ